MYINSRNGEIIAHIGTMFGGKTSALMSDVRKCRVAGLNTMVLKPRLDSRYSDSGIVTHLGDNIPAIPVDNLSDVDELLERLDSPDDVNVIAIDEFQFLDLDIDLKEFILSRVLKHNRKLIISGLNLDRNMDVFENIQKILPYATSIYQHKSICTSCGEPANYVVCKDTSESQVVLGGEDTYIPKCYNCYISSGYCTLDKDLIAKYRL